LCDTQRATISVLVNSWTAVLAVVTCVFKVIMILRIDD